MHERNCFLTLTYSDDNLKSPKLQYADFQNFMKKIRKLSNTPIGVFVTGEYGEKNKRPHWHCIIFGWAPSDLEYRRRNERGDRIYGSETIDRLWGKNDPELRPSELGSVSFNSASYCARYAAKKLVHGWDGTHEFNPISKKSSKHAIGKKWIETYWPDVFTHGYVVTPEGMKAPIPRYYEKWFQKHHFEKWLKYQLEIKLKKIGAIEEKVKEEDEEFFGHAWKRAAEGRSNSLTKNEIRQTLAEEKFKRLQSYLKL